MCIRDSSVTVRVKVSVASALSLDVMVIVYAPGTASGDTEMTPLLFTVMSVV